MRFPGYRPTRRRLLQSLSAIVVGAPLVRVGQWVVREHRKHPKDLPPIPWIGHC